MSDSSAVFVVKPTPEERAESSVPSKNPVPLIVSSPYAFNQGPLMMMGAPEWIVESQPACDPYTMMRLMNNTMGLLGANLNSLGITKHDGSFPRMRLDVDRLKNSYSPSHTDRPMDITPEDDDLYAAHGMGVVWARVPGDTETPLYLGDHQPTKKQIEAMLEEYDVYHEILQHLVTQHMDRFGNSFHISVQSFSREEAVMLGADPDNIPQFVVCDDDNWTSSYTLPNQLLFELGQKGYLVQQNEIFPTGEVTKRHASPRDGAHSVQLKVFEELFLDPNTLDHTPAFRKFSADFQAVMMSMAQFARENIRKEQPSADTSTDITKGVTRPDGPFKPKIVP